MSRKKLKTLIFSTEEYYSDESVEYALESLKLNYPNERKHKTT